MKKSLPFALLTVVAAGAAAALGVHLARKNSDNKLVARITDYINGIKDSKDITCECTDVSETVVCECEPVACECEETPCECEETPCECEETCECEDAPEQE